jgi:signal transduction histidine kinase
MLFQGLALAALVWKKRQDPLWSSAAIDPTNSLSATGDRPMESELDEEVAATINTIKDRKRQIEDWQVINDVNYLAWSKLLAAQIAELEGDYRATMISYEESLDHTSANGYVFEEALSNHLMAEFLLRFGSPRLARSAFREAIQLYRQIGATGVAKHIEVEHGLLLQVSSKTMSVAEVGVQTDFSGDAAPMPYPDLERAKDDEFPQNQDPTVVRIGVWQEALDRNAEGSGMPTLDVLDLMTILESSQVISSMLHIDQLLKTMCEIILQNCRGLATTAAIVIKEEGATGWSIAASGNPEKEAEAHLPGLPLNETALVAESVVRYCTRFREIVFLSNLIHDERFSNVSEAWAAQNPAGKSVIAIPICHGLKPLLGVLYLEGRPHAFTDRNLMVLQFLVNQIAISYSNALTLKEVEKISAFNNSMVDVQKAALTKALEAETRANVAKAEALHSVQLAEEAATAKSIFLANVSHELRTPLNGVIGNSELLIGSNLRQDQFELADSIRISADLLLTVINDILDFSKMEADKMQLFIVPFNADEITREVVRLVSYSNRDKKSLKDVKILHDLQLPRCLILGDPIRLRQVLGNLLGNSLKFTETGSITVGAKTDWETKDAAKLTFWVKDTGIGIIPQQLSKLFEPFSQADSSTARKYGGSGLGLSICKSIIESMMGGAIHLESEMKKGTTAWFSVTFQKARPGATPGDCRDGADEADEAATSLETEGSFNKFSSVPRDQVRICIAEDNPINQKIALQFMQKLGFKHVDAYDNGLLAVEGLRKMAIEGKPYHIILMDVQMPVLDGYEATEQLRRDPIDAVRRILVVAMTASAIQGDREKCLASGMNDYLAKPVRLGVLEKKINQYLQQVN